MKCLLTEPFFLLVSTDGEMAGIIHRTSKVEIVHDNSSLGNSRTSQVNSRVERGEFKNVKKKDAPTPIGASSHVVLQDKIQSQPQIQQPIAVGKSKSETLEPISSKAKQQQAQQQPVNRTSSNLNNNVFVQQQQQQNKLLPSDKRLQQQQPPIGAVVAAKDKPVVPSKKLVNSRPIGKDLSKHIPQFYFPMGQPAASNIENEATLQRIKDAFAAIEGGKANRVQMAPVAKVTSLISVTTNKNAGIRKHNAQLVG